MIPSTEALRQENLRHAITEILFFASVGDVNKIRGLCAKVEVSVADASCCDYDKRTPLHLAAAEGQLEAAEWLLKKGCNPNPVDRFAQTPLEDALIGEHTAVQKLLLAHGAKVYRKGIGLVNCSAPERSGWEESSHGGTAGSNRTDPHTSEAAGQSRGSTTRAMSSHSSCHGRRLLRREASLYILPDLLQQRSSELGGLELDSLIGRGSFGRVFKATWRGGTVAVKVLSHEGNRAAKLNALHEAVVSAHVHHPNVVTTYKIHTVQQIDTNLLDDVVDDDEALLRSFRIKTLANSPLNKSIPQAPKSSMASVGSASPFAAASISAFAPTGDLDTELAMDQILDTMSNEGSLLHSSSSAPFVPSPFDAIIEKALSGSLDSGNPTDTISELAKRMSMELESNMFKRSSSTSLLLTKSAEEIEQSRSRDRLDGMGAAFSMPRQPRAATSSSQKPAAAPAGAVPSQATSAFAAVNQASSVAERPPVSGGSRREAAPAAAAPSSEVDKFSFEDADATVETLLLMEYADLGTLHQLMLQGRLKSDEVAIMLCLMDVAAGMSYLHSIGLLHSDLKGANVLLKSSAVTPRDPRGFVCKIADFGMSRILEDNMTHVSTNSHGTVAYMSPEVLQRGAMAMPADVYSFSMLMLELWTGELIYKGVNTHQVLFKVFSGQKPDAPEDMPADYRRLMEDCWATDPAERPTFRDIIFRFRPMLAAAQAAAQQP